MQSRRCIPCSASKLGPEAPLSISDAECIRGGEGRMSPCCFIVTKAAGQISRWTAGQQPNFALLKHKHFRKNGDRQVSDIWLATESPSVFEDSRTSTFCQRSFQHRSSLRKRARREALWQSQECWRSVEPNDRIGGGFEKENKITKAQRDTFALWKGL